MQFARFVRAMRTAREQLAGRLLLALGVVLCAVAPAMATTFVRMDERDLAARASVAVIGTVTAVTVPTRAGLAGEPIVTRIVIDPEDVLFGQLPAGPLVLHEPGGRTRNGAERIFGAPQYRVGERVLVFATLHADGRWRTTAMAMGKYALDDQLATRRFDGHVAVIDPDTGELSEGPLVERSRLSDLVAGVRGHKPAPTRRIPPPPSPFLATGEGREGVSRASPNLPAPFTYLGSPSRWFEPDDGVPVTMYIDPTGDHALGASASVAAAVDALAAWTSVAGTSLLLSDGTLGSSERFDGCNGPNRIVFNDPFGEIDAPVDCRGVLGIGGYCYGDERRTVNGTAFNRIQLGKVTLADGYADCPFWTPCNVAQILTHEVGHAIGFGHSPDSGATMVATARFDGRCAGLAADDVVGVRFVYPDLPTATPTPTFTSLPSSTATATRTRTATPMLGTPHPGPYRVSGRVVYYTSGSAVAGVEVELSGAVRDGATTTANGVYAFDEVPNDGVLVRPRKTGDSGSALSALDAALVLQASAGLITLDPVQRVACDVTGNGSIGALDAARILQRVVGLIDRFPAAENCGSDWVFVPDAAQVPNLELVAPLLATDSCRAGGLSYSPLQSDATAQNFRAVVVGDCTGNWQPSPPGRGADPQMAPAGTELLMGPLKRVRGERWRLSVGLRSPAAMRALDLELRYDPDRLTPVQVRAVRLGSDALADHRITQPGRLVIALASAAELPADGRGVLVVDFDATSAEISSRLVRPYAIEADDHRVPTPPR
jgi:hypothetical protein